jgi:hypothetical protein
LMLVLQKPYGSIESSPRSGYHHRSACTTFIDMEVDSSARCRTTPTGVSIHIHCPSEIPAAAAVLGCSLEIGCGFRWRNPAICCAF